MSKNLIPKIAQMLGVAIGEEFKVKGYDGLTYKLTDAGLELTTVDGQKTKWFDHGALNSLLKGKMEIVKLPWRPDYRQMYWTFGLKDGIWVVVPREWEDYPAEILLADKGWAYRSKEEAEDALPRVAAKLEVDYKL